MADEDLEPTEPRAEDISDELAKKYDPERLLKIVSKRAGRGESLDHSVRSKYEKKFGVDLGHVRLYTGEFAEEFNKQRNAYAVTIGRTGMILMGGSPEKSMGSTAGQALLAHELTHVAQAKRGMYKSAVYSEDRPFGEEHVEEEAEAVEHAEGQGASAKAAEAGVEDMRAGDRLKADIEKIKARVLEMAADAARSMQTRNGPGSRRP